MNRSKTHSFHLSDSDLENGEESERGAHDREHASADHNLPAKKCLSARNRDLDDVQDSKDAGANKRRRDGVLLGFDIGKWKSVDSELRHDVWRRNLT